MSKINLKDMTREELETYTTDLVIENGELTMKNIDLKDQLSVLKHQRQNLPLKEARMSILD